MTGAPSGEAEERQGALAAPPDGALHRAFDGADISGLRHLIARYAAAAGLTGQPLDDFVLAVNELVTNAVRHGGGAGGLWIWRSDDALVCEVSDRGSGIADGGPDGHLRPSPRVAGGWGLWLARQLSESMIVDTGADGTRVRVSTALPDAATRVSQPD
jgi:anti-sigma regulatory factor (Ser/Thr protein kinase)